MMQIFTGQGSKAIVAGGNMPCADKDTCNAYVQLGCHWCDKDEHCIQREYERIDKLLDKDLEVRRNE